MREQKFRGKAVIDGEWIYGFFVTIAEKSYIIEEMETSNDYGDGTDLYAVSCSEVIPESVGQFTDETDINDNPIVEGDVVEFDLFGDGEKEKGVVVYKQAAFIVQTDYVPPMDGTHLGRPLAYELGDLIKNEKDVEVIGNEFEHLVGE